MKKLVRNNNKKICSFPKINETKAGILFVLPAVLIFIFLRGIPSIYAFYLSFTNYSISFIQKTQWIGLSNYIELLTNREFLDSLYHTFIYTSGTVIPSAVIALIVALLLDRKLYFLGTFRTIFYIPQVASWVAISMIWIYIFNPSFGIANYVLSLINIPKIGWLANPNTALFSIILVSIWRNVGYDIVIFLAGLQSIPRELYEAAKVDGANKFQQFWNITWPLLLPTTTFIVIITSIFALQAFDQIYVLTNGGPADSTTTVVFTIWRNAFNYNRMGYASAIAFVLFMLIFFFSLISLKITKQIDD